MLWLVLAYQRGQGIQSGNNERHEFTVYSFDNYGVSRRDNGKNRQWAIKLRFYRLHNQFGNCNVEHCRVF